MNNNIKINFYGKETTLIPSVEHYKVRDFMGTELPGLAVTFSDDEDGAPFAVLTKNFGEFIGVKNAAYIDSVNMREEWLDSFLNLGIAKQTAFTKHSGFGEYPLWIFDENWLREIGGIKYQEYSDAYDKYMNCSDSEEEAEHV